MMPKGDTRALGGQWQRVRTGARRHHPRPRAETRRLPCAPHRGRAGGGTGGCDSYRSTRRSDALHLSCFQRVDGFRRDLERSHPVAMVVEIRGEDQLVNVRLA
jgi:hypothetical protein